MLISRKKGFLGFTLVELMFALAILTVVSSGIYLLLATIARRVAAMNEMVAATSKVALFDKEFGQIVMPSRDIEFRDSGGTVYDNSGTAPDSEQDTIYFEVLNSSLNWVWMRIWYDTATKEIWLDNDISDASMQPMLLLDNVERFDYVSSGTPGNNPMFDIIETQENSFVTVSFCYLMQSVTHIETDPIRLRVTKRKRNT